MRHKWRIKDGIASCLNCPLVVKEYRIKRGGLPKCMNQKLDVPNSDYVNGLVICPKCKKTVPDNVFCLYCANQLRPLGCMKRG